MTRAKQMEDKRLMTFEELYNRRQAGRLTADDAAEMPGVSTRTFRRWRARFEEDGEEGLYDRRLDRISSNKIPVDATMKVLELFETRYFDYSVRHFHDALVADHDFTRSYIFSNPPLPLEFLLVRELPRDPESQPQQFRFHACGINSNMREETESIERDPQVADVECTETAAAGANRQPQRNEASSIEAMTGSDVLAKRENAVVLAPQIEAAVQDEILEESVLRIETAMEVQNRFRRPHSPNEPQDNIQT